MSYLLKKKFHVVFFRFVYQEIYFSAVILEKIEKKKKKEIFLLRESCSVVSLFDPMYYIAHGIP